MGAWTTSVAAALALAAPVAAQTIEYRVTCEPEAVPPRWTVRVEAKGLDPTRGPLELELPDWGEWTRVDSYYLHDVRARPEVRQDPDDPARFVLVDPDAFDGELELSYVLVTTRRWSRARVSHGILPFTSADYSFGYSQNTLMRPRLGGAVPTARRTLRFEAPRGWTVATGWGGFTKEEQTVVLPDDASELGNAVIAFGVPVGVHRSPRRPKEGELVIEVIELGSAADVTGQIAGMARALVPFYGRAAGRPLAGPVRIFVNDTGGGGTRTDAGLVVGFSVDDPGYIDSPYYRNTVAHELLHDWLGGFLEAEDGSLVWFSEGFDDYLSLWSLASLELVDRAWFARRMLEIERDVRGNSVFGTFAFTDDSIAWRAGGYEDVAYRGGALLALHLDVELRGRGHAGLFGMIRDLVAEGGTYSQESLRRWMEAHDMGDFHRRYVAGTESWPDAVTALGRVGYDLGEEDAPLTYLGVRAAGAGLGVVVELDPEGPAALAGMRVGDAITGYFPTRVEPPLVRDTVTTPFTFGLTRFEPDHPGTFVGVSRDGEDVKIELVPRTIPGGYLSDRPVATPGLAAFFTP